MKFAVTMSAVPDGSASYDFVKHTYITFLESAGVLPVLIPNVIADPVGYMQAFGVDGLLLTGGGDIDPALYHQPNTASHDISELRDTVEARLLAAAVEQQMPVFCICRGLQMLNVYFGGGLVQDIPTQCSGAIPHSGPAYHPVTISDPAVAEPLGMERIEKVNSYHHQGVTPEIAAPDLRIFATSDDGIIEGLRHPALPILGVQWHPERPDSTPEVDRKLFQLFTRGAFWQK